MFFQLDQITRASKSTKQFEKAKEKLQTLVVDAYQSVPVVKQSLTTTIAQILQNGKKRNQVFVKIQDDALHGYLIPSFIDYERFTDDKGDMPQWTRTVFQSQFQKQKKSLDVLAKKIYAAHSLSETKDNHSRQLNSFKMLSDRYRALSEHDETIDIMNQAQKMKNLTKLTSQKFVTYLNLIASKLMAFVEQMTAKCQNFGNELNNISVKTTNNNWIQPETKINYNRYIGGSHNNDRYMGGSNNNVEPIIRTQGENWLTRANRTLDRTFYKSAKNPQDYLLRQPKWLSTFTSDYYV